MRTTLLFCLLAYAPLVPGSQLVTMQLLQGSDAGELLSGGSRADDIFGGSGDDILNGAGGDDWLRGGDGDDEIRGGDGDDLISGGRGVDILYGGDGADVFVFDINHSETDEIADFDPAEGDEIWILLAQSADSRRVTLSSLKKDRVGIKLKRAPVNRVRLGKGGEVEVRIKNRQWMSLVKTGRADLKVQAQQSNDALYLKFDQRF